ncbi:hypothetical protein BLNAU_1741 [Blattamonas nauphoetae]|uniref:Uncharacterized protein n=1 Tax=Blattamonas nauphoetae TaxID=2049346 RepID=A0ABQ9YHH4_9EUKA|nr:hypothetical protein BLNAU_1741 [Blattamonas nauphoetae]
MGRERAAKSEARRGAARRRAIHDAMPDGKKHCRCWSESNENQRERKRREVSGAKTDKLWMASKAKSPIFSLVKPTHLENRIYGKADRIGDVECVLWKDPDLSEVDLVHLSQTTLADEVNRLDEMYSERNRRYQNRTKLARILDADEVVQSDTIRRFGGMPSMEERDNARLGDFAFQFGTAFQMRHTTFGDSDLSDRLISNRRGHNLFEAEPDDDVDAVFDCEGESLSVGDEFDQNSDYTNLGIVDVSRVNLISPCLPSDPLNLIGVRQWLQMRSCCLRHPSTDMQTLRPFVQTLVQRFIN